jgi:putative Holliday junction resolvase
VTRPRERCLGVDLGSRRIGLALTDPSGVLASPHDTLERSGELADDHRAILAAATDAGAARIVIGLPRSLSGKMGPAARSVLEEVEAITELARAVGIEVDTYDERFSTMIAQRNLRDATPRRNKRQRAQRERIDASAAAVILQSWLDAQGPSARGSDAS